MTMDIDLFFYSINWFLDPLEKLHRYPPEDAGNLRLATLSLVWPATNKDLQAIN